MEGYGALGFSVNPLQCGISYQLPRDKDIRSHTGVGPSPQCYFWTFGAGEIDRSAFGYVGASSRYFCSLALHVHLDPECFRCIDEALQLCRIRFAHMIKSQLLQYA